MAAQETITLQQIAGYDTDTFRPEGLDRSETNFWFTHKTTGAHFKIGVMKPRTLQRLKTDLGSAHCKAKGKGLTLPAELHMPVRRSRTVGRRRGCVRERAHSTGISRIVGSTGSRRVRLSGKYGSAAG
mmetsp:Transcript_73387/g.201513  ORF Transcript_73387/g.201513 Transcript_73387/m.201513 type:complete len:128 (-) Transcript_73387:171-554(-)